MGLSDESNLSILEIAESGMELEDRINQIKEDLLEQGVPASKIESMSYKQAKDFAEQNYSKLAYKLKVLNEKEKGPDSLGQLKEVPEGTPLTYENAQAFLQQADGDEERALRVAKKLGYTIPGEDLTVLVPSYLSVGDKIVVKTEDGSFVEKAE